MAKIVRAAPGRKPGAVLAASVDAFAAAAGEIYAEAVAGELTGRRDAWPQVRDALARTAVLFGLLGRVQAIESMRRSGIQVEVETEDVDPAAEFADAPPIELQGFADLPFIDALRAFEGRVPELNAAIDRLADASRRAADKAVAKEREAVRQTIVRAVAKGDIDPREARSAAAVAGIQASAEGRLDTVYRTTTAKAFNAGAYRQMQRAGPAVVAYQLTEIQDHRTRGNPRGLYPHAQKHYQMNGFVAAATDDIWQRIWPPNGWNCRGSVAPISVAAATRRGWMTADGTLDHGLLLRQFSRQRAIVEAGHYPDEGFETNPATEMAI